MSYDHIYCRPVNFYERLRCRCHSLSLPNNLHLTVLLVIENIYLSCDGCTYCLPIRSGSIQHLNLDATPSHSLTASPDPIPLPSNTLPNCAKTSAALVPSNTTCPAWRFKNPSIAEAGTLIMVKVFPPVSSLPRNK